MCVSSYKINWVNLNCELCVGEHKSCERIYCFLEKFTPLAKTFTLPLVVLALTNLISEKDKLSLYSNNLNPFNAPWIHISFLSKENGGTN